MHIYPVIYNNLQILVIRFHSIVDPKINAKEASDCTFILIK